METSPGLVLLSAALWTTAFSSRYTRLYHPTSRMDWTSAQNYCRTEYTDLVTLHSQKEVDSFAAEISGWDESIIWIGLSRIKGNMTWSNGDDVDYTNYSSEAERMKPYCNTMSASGLWENVNCAELRSFMCYNQGLPQKYTLIEQKMSWCGAQSYCRLQHTDLVSVHNDSQNEELSKIGAGKAPSWIGLMHTEWEWSDGECSTYWERYGPVKNRDEEDCVYWLSPMSILNTASCKAGFIGACYKDQIHLIKEKKTWEEALDHCDHKYEGGLLSIQSQEDQRAVEAELKKRNVTSGPVWLGLRQSRLFGFWIWANGLNVGWSNWKGGSQPEQPLSHICGAMVTSRPGRFKWSDRDCLSKSYFLCEGEER